MKTVFEMPLKAQKIIITLMENELYQENFMTYVAQYLRNGGYPDAANHFWNKAEDERRHFVRWSDYLQSRGVEAEMPAVKKPEFKFTDLKSAVAALFDLEITATELYDTAYTDLCEVDNMSCRKAGTFLDEQEWAMAEYSELWKQLEGRTDVEDQKEFSEQKWGNKPIVETAG